MADAIDRSESWRKLRSTPLRDVLRGRITGRLDWRGRLRSAAFPPPISQLIHRVVRRTRLWRLEKAAVADELIAHFQDGIDAGATADALIQSFGDPKRAAKLIRRAKLRARALHWLTLRIMHRIAIVLLLIYGVLFAVFYFGRPRVAVDYFAQLNQKTLQTPESERAWLIYQRAIAIADSQELPVGLSPQKEITTAVVPDDGHTKSQPVVFRYSRYGKHWPEITGWLRENQSIIAMIRDGASKPILGAIHAPPPTNNITGSCPYHRRPDLMDQSLISDNREYLQKVNGLAWVLAADFKLAAEQNNADLAEKDFDAGIGMATQLQPPLDNSLIDNLVGLRIRGEMVLTAQQILAKQPGVWSDATLVRIAHLLSKELYASDFLNLEGERMLLADIFQRTYSASDGGYLTFRGAVDILILDANLGHSPENQGIWDSKLLAGPLLMLVGHSRGYLLATADRLFDQQDRAMRQPLRQSISIFRALEHEVDRWKRSVILSARYFPLTDLIVNASGATAQAERYLGARDGTAVGIALEVYHRHHGEYPDSLAQLVPEYLPEVPLDRITGDSVKYRIVDGHPLIYSVGMDRVDDGGKPNADHMVTAFWDWPRERAFKGDWILYPEPIIMPDNE